MLKEKISFVCVAVCLSTSLFSAVNEVIPGDYEAPNVGVKLATLYLAQKKVDGPYVDGVKQTNDSATALITALKLTATIDVGGYTLCPMVALPYSKVKAEGTLLPLIIGDKSAGFSDLVVGATGWLINDKKKNQYLAATLLAFAPSGKYDSKQILNVGENRYKTTLNIGYVQKLSDDFTVELSPEVALYGKNSDYLGKTMTQAPSYAITTNVRYNLTSQTTPFVTFQRNYGGKTTLDGVLQDDESGAKRVSVGAYYYTLGGTQIFLRYAKEFGVQSGMKTADDLLLRLQWWFM